MDNVLNLIIVLSGCITFFNLGRAYETVRELRRVNDEYAAKLR